MKFLMLADGHAFMGLDIFASIFDTEERAHAAFKGAYGIEYPEYNRLFDVIQEWEDGVEPSDEDMQAIEGSRDLFWYDDRDPGSDTAFKMVEIFEVGSDPVMVIGQGSFM